ncbi:Uncharacterised protein [Vibrio cholerae]|nr:Uncharacterised protein [Vibrio cholerae]CSI62465.1 Uncharacterised protein [Vibrio cholerae]
MLNFHQFHLRIGFRLSHHRSKLCRSRCHLFTNTGQLLNSGVQLCDGGIHILAQLGNFIFTVRIGFYREITLCQLTHH